jgi:hypothetical protein
MRWGIGDPYVHYPVSWHGRTAIRLDRNPDFIALGWPSISEVNGYHLPIKPGDHIVFKAWIWADPSTIGDTDFYGGISIALCLYANGMICEIATPNGQTSYPNWPVERGLCWAAWGSTQWKQVTIDFIVQNSYITDPDGAYPPDQMVTPTAFIPLIRTMTFHPTTEQASIYFADTELYINP